MTATYRNKDRCAWERNPAPGMLKSLACAPSLAHLARSFPKPGVECHPGAQGLKPSQDAGNACARPKEPYLWSAGSKTWKEPRLLALNVRVCKRGM